MFTVTQLARSFGISRSTLLYYEREGLLVPANRSDNGYRWYGVTEKKRLNSIVSYRSYGIPVAEIKELLDRKSGKSQAEIMRQHFNNIEREVNALRQQQRAIVALLQEPTKRKNVSKDQWVKIMRSSGFDEATMTTWHRTFEEMEPEEHQRFLESLNIDDNEIKVIRNQ